MSLITGLTLLFVAAKLFGYTHYGWLVAFSPVLIGMAIEALATVGSHLVRQR